jgi:glycerate kinase
MKILVAPNAFKESLTAPQAAQALALGIKAVLPAARITQVPIADGGDGTLEAIVAGTRGRILKARVKGPLGNPLTAEYGITGDGKTAIIEMSRASGLALVPRQRRNPMQTTSFGTGQLIVAALEQGVRHILLGIGGSATVDGGVGALQALGIRFLDRRRRSVGPGGKGLLETDSIDLSQLHPALQKVRLQVACDVDNPLVGPTGAAAVFGPQKGATVRMVGQLDKGLGKLSSLIKELTGKNVAHIPGTGAAGGIAGSFLGLLQAELKPGSELVFKLLNVEKLIPRMDWIITGEGQIDFQTPFGKGPGMLAKLARKYRIPVIGIAGAVADDIDPLFEQGFTAVFSIVDRPMELSEAMRNAHHLMQKTAEQVARLIRAAKRRTP